MDTSEKLPRGLCFHEAGHAVVLHSYHVAVQSVWVNFTQEKGWHGSTDKLPDATDHLRYMDRVTILRAGKSAEELFDCPFHQKAWRLDGWEICKLLERNGVLHERHLRLAQADTCARAILDRERKSVLRLVDWLAEYRCINGATFLTVTGALG